MEIVRSGGDTALGPAEWFTGTVYIDALALPSGRSRLSANVVRFAPGARTAWHRHPNGQTLFITEGVGLVQRRGGAIERVQAGDRVFFEADEDHWHGASPTRFMTHLALIDVDADGSSATWGPHVSDSDYHAAPAEGR
ncbi:MAG: cupin domain-containing protein [Dehalococcoidia bacterium]|nr:cupin domain-containing protein [Dehalococcoidia bacterium]